MPTESSLPRLNWSIVPDASSDENWNPNRISSPGRDASIVRQSRPYYTLILNNCLLSQAQANVWERMKWHIKWHNGAGSLILVRVPIAYEIGTITGRDSAGNAIVTPSVIGSGTGEGQVYQLRRVLLSPIDNSEVFHYIRKPHLDYPDLPNISGRGVADDMDELKIYVDGDLLPRGDGTGDTWSCDRETGLVTTGADGVKSATGGFYTVMILPDNTPRKRLQGGELFQFDGGLTLYEPFNAANF